MDGRWEFLVVSGRIFSIKSNFLTAYRRPRMKKFFKFGGKGLKRSPSETSNQSSSWSLNSGGSRDSLGTKSASSGDFKEKDFHKIHKAALNGDLEKLKEHLKKQAVDTTGRYRLKTFVA